MHVKKNHHKRRLIAALTLSGIISSPTFALANDSTELEELRAKIQELDQQIKILARKNELTEETAATKKKETPVVKITDKGFGIESADGKNSIRLGGLIQYDYRNFQNGANDVRNRNNNRAGNLDSDGFHDANDTWLARRLRPNIQGTLFGIYDYRFQEEFAGGSASVVDAYVDGRFNPAFKVRVGKYKPYVGLERLQAGADIKFIERSYVSNNILPNRDQGVSVYGDVFGEKLNYAIGFNNGVVDGGNASTGAEFDSDKEITARLFATPFKDDVSVLSGLSFGIAGTTTNIDGERNLDFTNTSAADGTRNGLPSYVTNAQQTFFRYGSATVADGRRTRITPQASYYYGPFGLITEYARVSQDVSLILNPATSNGATAFVVGSNKKLTNDAWQIAATYLLTGEDSSFKGVKPKNDFDLDKGGWGAWELVARYSEMNIDSDAFKNKAGTSFSTGTYANLSESAKSAKSWTAGVNWYLNTNAKIQLNYEHTKFDGGAGIGTTAINAGGTNVRDRENEDSLFARFQVAF